MVRIIAWIYIVVILTSCSHSTPRVLRAQLEDQLDRLDGAGKADSVVRLVSEYYGPDQLDTTSFHVRIIYCRSLAHTGAVEVADSLYRRYIAHSKWLSEKWRFNSEYLIMLAEERKPAGMRQYADTLVRCCADSMHSFKDMRALHYFLASQIEGDCEGMRLWVDSLAYWAPKMKMRLPSDEEIAGYRQELLSTCP